MDSTSPQDVGLPYMTDGRHAPDTLFLVAEGDFRFERDHCVSGRDWLAEVDEFVDEHLKTATSIDARGMLNPAVPPEEEPISPTTDDEGGGGDSPASVPDWSGTEPDARTEDAEAEPDARSKQKMSLRRKRGPRSGDSLRANAMRAGRRTSLKSSRTWCASPPLRTGRAKEIWSGTPG